MTPERLSIPPHEHAERDHQSISLPRVQAFQVGMGLQNTIGEAFIKLHQGLEHTDDIDSMGDVSILGEYMAYAGENFQNVVTGLTTSQETRVVREDGNWHFLFSETKQEDLSSLTIKDGISEVPENLAKPLIAALSYSFGDNVEVLEVYEQMDIELAGEQIEALEHIAHWIFQVRQAESMQIGIKNGEAELILSSEDVQEEDVA